MANMLSLGDIARRHGVSAAQVKYAISTRGIEPIGRVGGRHVYDESAAARVGEAMKQIQSTKSELVSRLSTQA